jgi:zinc D-Ala-D-Ala carboxypeptidase
VSASIAWPRGTDRIRLFRLAVRPNAGRPTPTPTHRRPTPLPRARFAPTALAELRGAAPKPTHTATELAPELAARFTQAREAAAAQGVELFIASGWRSPADQQRLLDDAVATHGSRAEAERWVLPPDRSAHVQGLAIDVGATDGALWLDEHGSAYGLCRVYLNELWHFEPLVEPGGTCPAMVPDATATG